MGVAQRHADKADKRISEQKLKDDAARFKTERDQLEREVKKLKDERGKFQEIVEEAVKVIHPLEPYAKWAPPSPAPPSREYGMVLKASDWQIGEVINPEETEGFGRFNYEIATQRVCKLAEKVLAQAEMYRRGGCRLRQLDVFSEADLLSGNIHYELEVTNEWPVPIAVAKAAQLFAEMVRRLSTGFEVVKIWEMSADNHGRLTRRNQAKQGAANNYSRLAHEFANALLGNLAAERRVEIVLGEGTKLLANVVGQKFLVSHGHEVMGSLGIPYYGMSRAKAREAVKRMNTDKTFDYISCGHWHVPGVIEGNILVNGALTGTTEFDHQQGRHAAPQQVSFMVHPSKGIFGWTPWIL